MIFFCAHRDHTRNYARRRIQLRNLYFSQAGLKIVESDLARQPIAGRKGNGEFAGILIVMASGLVGVSRVSWKIIDVDLLILIVVPPGCEIADLEAGVLI